MGKKTKIGKQRKDRFYKLAKETGFRSRAAFKLLQLNRKFEFLQKSRVLIDLCAAPGGWLQVAKQAMPVSSVLIGIDLVPIRPIANVITLKEDITTDKCRKAIKTELRTWKADTVLNDGAPNVGKNWSHDAFMQNQLTLSALKLATDVLVKGGWFITKVFRSKDYLSLVWVFKKLFKRVHITKPQASRSESAEIFIVCEGYLAPDRIDPKFLDPAHIFKEIPGTTETKSTIERIMKTKKKADGYEDEDELFFNLRASEFIFCENHMERLGKCRQIIFDDEDIRDHKLTTPEIKECCKDIKVLGKADLKSLLHWRKHMRLAIKGAEDDDKSKELDTENLEEKEIDDAVKEAEELDLSMLREAKKKKKKILKQKRKTHERMNLKMIIKDDDPVIAEEKELFKLSIIKDPKDLNKVGEETNLEFGLEPQQTEVDEPFISTYRKKYELYSRDEEDKFKQYNTIEKEESLYSSDTDSEELEFESQSENDDDEDKERTEAILKGGKNPLMVDLVDRPARVKDTVNRWFDKGDFAGMEEEEDLELDLLAETYEKTNGKPDTKEVALQKGDEKKKKKKQNDVETVPEKRKKRVRLDPEGLALASLMVQSKKMKRDIVENAYNRYATGDENLPGWFVQDEKRHYKPNLPVTAEMVRENKQRLWEINARPIRKVVEAKARKKRRRERLLEKAKKRAEKITDHPDMTDKEKAEQLKAIYKKALPKQEKKVTYVVARKGGGPMAIRPSGVKGRYKVVDPRMKKDNIKEKMMRKSQKGKKDKSKIRAKKQKVKTRKK